MRGSGPRTAPARSARRRGAPPSPSAGPPGSTSPPGRTTFECQRRSRSAATSARPRPLTTLSGRALTMSSSAVGRACSSLSLTSSQAFGSSPLILTSAHLPASFSPCKLELQLPLLQRELRVDDGRPRPAVPEHHRPRPVLAFRDDALEGAVLDRVVLDAHGEPLVARVEGRALGHGPAQQDAVPLQAEVVVEPRRRVLLDAVRGPARGARLAGRLGRPGEVALLLVVLESHPRDSLRDRKRARPSPRREGRVVRDARPATR